MIPAGCGVTEQEVRNELSLSGVPVASLAVIAWSVRHTSNRTYLYNYQSVSRSATATFGTQLPTTPSSAPKSPQLLLGSLLPLLPPLRLILNILRLTIYLPFHWSISFLPRASIANKEPAACQSDLEVQQSAPPQRKLIHDCARSRRRNKRHGWRRRFCPCWASWRQFLETKRRRATGQGQRQ